MATCLVKRHTSLFGVGELNGLLGLTHINPAQLPPQWPIITIQPRMSTTSCLYYHQHKLSKCTLSPPPPLHSTNSIIHKEACTCRIYDSAPLRDRLTPAIGLPRSTLVLQRPHLTFSIVQHCPLRYLSTSSISSSPSLSPNYLTSRKLEKMASVDACIYRQHSVTATEQIIPSIDPLLDLEKNYKLAIELLNQLQTNASYIKQAVEKERSSNVVKSLESTRYFLSLVGIKPDDLNQLNVIHVAGTKGKGSTCAFVESILRHNGLKTGFYSSPHLVVVRERIRINGQPVTEEQFAFYFGQVYNKINECKGREHGMPAYFNFLTVLAFYMFLVEKVDVAILEVGIGGEYDCTNVVPRPVVTGITSLDLDHCKLLGDTIEKIAWQKSGICKEGVPLFTVPQNEKAMQVLRERAAAKKSPFYVSPNWSLYPSSSMLNLGDVQQINASLAVQLAHFWLSKRFHPKHMVPTVITEQGAFADVVALSQNNYSVGLAKTKWLGRCDTINRGCLTYFLDAAHTMDSMNHCANWFRKESHFPLQRHQKNHLLSKINSHIFKHGVHSVNGEEAELKAYRVIIFNCTGERDPAPLFSKLASIRFDHAIFTTNCIEREKSLDSDNSNLTVTAYKELEIRDQNAYVWAEQYQKGGQLTVVDCITEAISTVDRIVTDTEPNLPVHVLVTGSVHLVGGFIGLLHPNYLFSNAV